MASVYALIPARAGSKGVPGKNIRDLAGAPLLAWSVRAALLAETVERVIVSTDSEDYAKIARDYGAEVPFIRPDEHAGDMIGDEPVVRHLIDWLLAAQGPMPDLIAYLRPTTPLRDPAIIDAAVKTAMAEESATSVRSIHEMSESAYKTFEREGDYLKPVGGPAASHADANAPRQSLPATYIGNGYVDVFRTTRLLSGQSLQGEKVYGFMTPPAAEVDTAEDFDFLEFQAERRPEIKTILFGAS